MRKAVKRKPEPEVIIRSADGSFLRLCESGIARLYDGRYVTKQSVRASLKGALHIEVEGPCEGSGSWFTNAEPRCQSLGCMVFRGANLAKLRKWAGVK